MDKELTFPTEKMDIYRKKQQDLQPESYESQQKG